MVANNGELLLARNPRGREQAPMLRQQNFLFLVTEIQP